MYHIEIDRSRDALLTQFGKATLADRYLMPGESYQDAFARVAKAFARDSDHAQRMYDYISKLWFMPSTPILSNGGTDRGLPISCFVNEVEDSLEGIASKWDENVWLAARGGGLGTYWGNVRSIGEKVGEVGKTSGIMPFIKVSDSLTLAISQGSLRRGNGAVYLPIDHPEIEEFIEMRRPTGGDINRKSLNLHHGIVISDAFMRAVEGGDDWNLISPKTNEVIRTVKARDLWVRILQARIETGEPYMLFIDTVHGSQPLHQKELDLWVKTSNLCSEITLPTGKDHRGADRTAVCCLGSLNLETYEEWDNNPRIVEDCLKFLATVLETFVFANTPREMGAAKYSAYRERSLGLGVMGFHSFLQKNGIPFDSVMAKVWNNKIFNKIQKEAMTANANYGKINPAPDNVEAHAKNPDIGPLAWSNTTAIAPTASISIICGGASPGIEPNTANIFVHKTLSGSTVVRNKYLEAMLNEKAQKLGLNVSDIWLSILEKEGSVQHLDILTEHEKAVFRTAFEIDQRWIVELAADRAPLIDQAQSVNLFLPADISKRELHDLHFSAWQKGLKSLYYCRSKAINRAEVVTSQTIASPNNGEECLACQ